MIKELLSGSLVLLGTLSPGVAGVETAVSEQDHDPPTGLRFATPDELKHAPQAEMPFAGANPPLRVDLSENMPEPGLQGKQNSCVAWASAYAVKTYQEKIEQRYTLLDSGRLDLHKVFSPAFVYNQINQGRDGGATLMDALDLLSGRGAVSWAEMPYKIDNFTLQPSPDLLRQALRYRIAYWRRVNIRDPHEIKAQLMAGYPIMIGALVDESLYRLKPGMVWQHSAGRSLGGHAMVMVGYDEGRHAYKLMNSWGTGWADHGFGWIDYRQFNTVIREGYVAKDALNDRPLEVASTPRSTLRLPHPTEGEGPANAPLTTSPAPPAKPSPAGNVAKADPNNRNTAGRPVHDEGDKVDDLVQQAEEQNLELVSLRRQRVEKGWLILEGQAVLSDAQAGRETQVLVRLYTDAAATRPLKVDGSAYAMPDGSAVAIGMPRPVDQGIFNWQARIPLAQLPDKSQTFWGRPVLYVDHFGVATGTAIKLEP